MISLSVKKMPKLPLFFSPNVEQIDATALGEKKKLLQTVYCDHKDFCNNIEEYLENRK